MKNKPATNPEPTSQIPALHKMFGMPATVVLCAICILLSSPMYADENPQTTQLSGSESADIRPLLQRGEAALAVGDYETAFAEYRAAVDEGLQEPDAGQLSAAALDGFAKAGKGLAELRIAEGRWQDAEDTIRTVLQPEYHPNDKPAQKLLTQLEDPLYFNKTVTPEFVYQVETIKHLLNVADGLSGLSNSFSVKVKLGDVIG